MVGESKANMKKRGLRSPDLARRLPPELRLQRQAQGRTLPQTCAETLGMGCVISQCAVCVVRSWPKPAGFACNGRYCDNISLFCVPLVKLRTIHCWTTRPVSEEGGGTLSFQEGNRGWNGRRHPDVVFWVVLRQQNFSSGEIKAP
jgi:hypothetical protein